MERKIKLYFDICTIQIAIWFREISQYLYENGKILVNRYEL